MGGLRAALDIIRPPWVTRCDLLAPLGNILSPFWKPLGVLGHHFPLPPGRHFVTFKQFLDMPASPPEAFGAAWAALERHFVTLLVPKSHPNKKQPKQSRATTRFECRDRTERWAFGRHLGDLGRYLDPVGRQGGVQNRTFLIKFRKN